MQGSDMIFGLLRMKASEILLKITIGFDREADPGI